MKKTLENLWYMYQMENRVPYDAQEEQVIDQLVAAEKMLHEQLSEVQKAALKKYEDLLDEIGGICEKRAFIKGIRFATKFMLEILYV